MSTDVQMAGQVAFVTGASRGIGRAIALELATRGFIVFGTATTEAGAQSIGDALSAYPGCSGLCLNVNDAVGIDAAVNGIVKQHGGLQVLVNNAGITRDTLSMRMKDEDWDAVIDTNLKAVFRLSRAVIRPMMKQRYGTSSTSPRWSVPAATRARPTTRRPRPAWPACRARWRANSAAAASR